MRYHFILILVAMAVAGCSQSRKTPSAEKSDGTAHPSAKDFEHVKDPPFSADTRFTAGQLAESQGALDKAISQYREAIKIDPKHLPALNRLGVLLTQTRQFPQAIEIWKQYVAATNGTASAYNNLGLCFDLAGKTKEAELAYAMGVKQDPKNQHCRMNFGLLLARTGREDEAIEQLSAVLQPADVQYNLASTYEQMGKKAEARIAYRKALELQPEFWEAQSRLSKLD